MPKPKKPVDSAAELIPDHSTISSVRDAAKDCQACDLYKRGTQTVFGEGARRAELMFVGEQPGDAEDLAGRPFVGPAARLLDRALEETGIDRAAVYVTNVVKHFKWEPRGKRRIHKKPNAAEIAACRPWLDTEIQLVEPRDRLSRRHRRAGAARTSIQGNGASRRVHPLVARAAGSRDRAPASLLRAPDEETRHRETKRFIDDLRTVARALSSSGSR